MGAQSGKQSIVEAVNLAPPRKRREKSGPTIRDVASACSVSAMTVSNVLNGRQGEVSPDTRERILGAMRRLNYHPSAAARALSRKRTETIGVVFGIIGSDNVLVNPYTSGILQGTLQAAKQHGYDVNIVTRDWHSAEVSATAFKDERTDGLLLIAPSQDSDIVMGLKALGRPLVTISGDAEGSGVVSVDLDDIAVGKLVIDHLYEQGHVRIAHITGNMDLVSTHRRLEGYRQSLDARGITTNLDYVISIEYNATGAEEATRRLMALPVPPTAIFCGNDTIAFAVITALRHLGIGVPKQVSVVGVDDVDAAALITPPLTTVRQPLSEIGFRSAETLIQIIEGHTFPVQMCLVHPQMVERRSTCPPAR